MQRLLSRLPLEQTELGAMLAGKLICLGVQGAEFRSHTREVRLSDATREALVLWLNAANGSRLKSRELVAIDHVPIKLDNSLRFGDVVAEEEL